MITCLSIFFLDCPVVNDGKGKCGRILIYFCMGLGLGMKVLKRIREALSFNAKAAMGYAIDNNLLESHLCRRVWCLVQNT
jgi:hypothetical protein